MRRCVVRVGTEGTKGQKKFRINKLRQLSTRRHLRGRVATTTTGRGTRARRSATSWRSVIVRRMQRSRIDGSWDPASGRIGVCNGDSIVNVIAVTGKVDLRLFRLCIAEQQTSSTCTCCPCLAEKAVVKNEDWESTSQLGNVPIWISN